MCFYRTALSLPNLLTHRSSDIPPLARSGSHAQRSCRSASRKVRVNFISGGRKTIRFPLQAPVVFWWTDENGTHQQGEGRSRDISESGAFVFAAACPPLGASVGLRIWLEGAHDGTETVPIEVDGLVRRVEQSDARNESSGFALLNRSWKLHDGVAPIED
jgi:hypothetical protein